MRERDRERREMEEREGAERREGEERGRLERRVHHLRVAAENLAAIEMHDLAERLMREAEEIEQDLHRPHGDRPHDPHAEFVDRVHHGFEDLERRINELNSTCNQMGETIERLHRRQ